MQKLTLTALTVAVSLALSGCNSTTSPSTQAQSTSAAINLPSVDVSYDSFTLDNGLKVIVHTDRKAPIVAVNVWYNVGSKHEKLGKTGFAHLFEHLMFNGTENYNDEYFGPFEKAGATEQNGTTNNDRTNYFQNVPTTALDMALWMESDRMGHLLGAITQEKLDEQRGVVQNEKRQGEARPYGKMWGAVAENTFPKGHPYSWSVIGSMEDLNAASLDDVHQWFKDYYGPNNAVLVLAGDIDVATAKEKANKYFGDIKPGKPVAQIDAWVAKRTGTKRMTMQDRVPSPRIVKVWNTAEKGTADSEYLSLLADVLAGGKNSRLYKRLVYQEQKASMAFAFNYSRTMAGQIMIGVDTLPGANLNEVETIIDEELAKLLSEGPTSEELNRIKFSNAASWVKNVEGVGGFGGKSDILASGMVYHGDPVFYKKQQAIQNAATPADIQQAGKKWLTDGDFVLTIEPFEKLSHNQTGADRSKVPSVDSLPELKLPEVQTARLNNGLEVVLAQRSDTPSINMELNFDGGFSSTTDDKAGLALFTMKMLREGTNELSSLELAAELEKIGASLYSGASLDNADVSLSALKVNWQRSAELFSQAILNPAFNEQDIERIRKLTIDGIKKEKSTPMSNALRELPPRLYGKNHAYSQPLTGSGYAATVNSFTREDLVNYKNTWLRPDNARLVVVGDISMDELTATLNTTLADWQAPNTAKPTVSLTQVTPAQTAKVYVLDKPDTPQSLIVAGLLGPDRNSLATDQDIKLDIMNTIIGGSFTSRINMNLREDKGWSYGARSALLNNKGQSPFFVYAPVQTDKTKESIQEILKELENYTGKKPATDEELNKVVSNKVAKLPGRYEKKWSLLSSLSSAYKRGKDVSDLEQYGSKVKNTTLNDVKKQAKSLIKKDQMTWVIVGDVAKIKAELESLNLGEIVYLKD
ncbi:pitrilysin family protein [Pseudoalteromonas sp. MMG024]|uniref:M16 family metallopeptidase n=1 Tax=Pseudoalteromonas sp. MMG024 TaxID=2909980 RepID=UPI001F17FBE8|nr:pitrilysin family protein [Pseudoalteromonas sp. MMG024]MCF6458806.1 insulinase family protein [Pseudoalteromonas sp. MMG024]